MDLLDVTLREGDQMPGRSYDADQKIDAGLVLDDLGLSYLQVGFPATGEKDREVIRTLAPKTNADIVGIARAVERDVELALEADADVVEVFGPLSDLQLEHAIGVSRSEMFDRFERVLDLLNDHGVTAHVTLVDAFRTQPKHVIDAATRLDADMVTLADTVGVATPSSTTEYLDSVNEHIDPSRLGVHLHDDLGVATANACVAYEAGVGKADVSVASLGERAGNPALEELVAIGDLEYDEPFEVDAERLLPVCRSVLSTLEEDVHDRKALLGTEVMEHESGIHTAVMLEEPAVFEPFNPARFGGDRRLLFGAGTGAGGAKGILQRAGIEPTDERVGTLLAEFETRGPLETHEAVSLAKGTFDA
ncbi:LeuA family protein [Natronorubrum daqingense]|uniref:2-isopropylmalate synthase n=1 Tax=Natronorubrum daqingense TaxID=588898 RepID=A0A1N7FYI5_9EURY|nr:citramalate synthase [Natronorubrum daqingense]APX98571.1 citramalate synthase [Natronorubrum daqingense]SIS05410.1 2-isopropylmalate synthase [Natronorubrum daqingense]